MAGMTLRHKALHWSVSLKSFAMTSCSDISLARRYSIKCQCIKNLFLLSGRPA